MASRLYPTTRPFFRFVVRALVVFGVQASVSPTAFALLALYVAGLILLDRRQTPWRIQDWLPARCHDALNRLLRTMPLSTRSLMRAMVQFCRRLGVPGYLCIDDVVVEKAYSRVVAWTGWTFSFAQKRKVYGLHIVVITWCAGVWRIPVAFRLWRPKAACAPRQYRTKVQLAQAMMTELLTQDRFFEYVVFDTHYTAGWFTKWLTRLGIPWVGTLDPRTIVHFHGKRYAVAQLGFLLKLRWRKGLNVRARAVTVYAPTYGPLRLAVTRNRHGNYEWIATNQLTDDLTTIVSHKRSRWAIETLFRDTKQFSALSACQCRTDQAWVRHVAAALLAFAVLQSLRRCPEETLGTVKERLQRQAFLADARPPDSLKARAPLIYATA